MIVAGAQALVKTKRLTESAILPVRGSQAAAGFDLFADESITLYAGTVTKIHTGIAIELPPGTVGLFFDRSSMGARGLFIAGGVIDSDYRGELIVMLYNSTTQHIPIQQGQKITQMVIVPYIAALPYEVSELTDTERRANGFGSTNKQENS